MYHARAIFNHTGNQIFHPFFIISKLTEEAHVYVRFKDQCICEFLSYLFLEIPEFREETVIIPERDFVNNSFNCRIFEPRLYYYCSIKIVRGVLEHRYNKLILRIKLEQFCLCKMNGL